MTDNPFIPTTSGLQPNAGLLGTPGAITATSTTTQSIAEGSLTFSIQAQCAFAPGMWVSITNADDTDQWMWAKVESYDGISQLDVTVTVTNGGGRISNWQIALAGGPGTQGATGATGATGAAGANAGPVVSRTNGLKITNHSGTENSKIDITALQAMLANSSGVSVVASAVSVTIDLTTGTSTSAANGMDGHSVGTSNWLYTYLISNGSTTAGLATKTSPLSSAPTLPAGYTYSQYTGAMYIDGSGNLLRSIQLGRKSQYKVTAATNTAALPIMDSGSKGSISTPTWTAIAVGAFVPPTAGSIVGVAASPSNAGAMLMVAPNNAYGAMTSTTNIVPIATGDAYGNALNDLFIFVLESTNIYWASNAASAYVACQGWEDYCVAA